MKCQILHESRGRLRVHLCQPRMTIRQADLLDLYLNRLPCVRSAKVYERTGDAVILYEGPREEVLEALARFREAGNPLADQLPEQSGRELNQQYQNRLAGMVAFRAVRMLFFPAPLRMAYTALRAVRYLRRGLRCLLRGRLRVEVLDAVSIGVSLARGDFATAGAVMFLLRLGELLEEWTHTGIAVDQRPYETFETADFLPFQAGLTAGGDTAAVLVSHNIITCMDPDLPASLSPEVHRVLREELHFDGVAMTDDLAMEAVAAYAEDGAVAVMALEAGNDLVITTDYRTQIPKVLEAVESGALDASVIEGACRRVLTWKQALGLL